MIRRYSREEMSNIWSDTGRFNIWFEVELAVHEEFEKRGVVPAGSGAAIRKTARIDIQRIDEIERDVKHDVIAFVSHIAEQCGSAGGYLHRGMTSNDLVDTSFAIQLKRASELLIHGVEKVRKLLKEQAIQYKMTPCIGRTHGIHAEPITFGLKVLSWYAELTRCEKRLRDALDEISVGKLSGAVGTYTGITPEIEASVLGSLGLRAETVPSQVVHRDRHAELFATLAGLGSSIERFAVEIRHLQRTEVREVEENFGANQKGSSAMPHKRNPILSENVCGLARLLRGYAVSSFENVALWHERDISHSSVERVIAPDAFIVADFMLNRFYQIVSSWKVSPQRMMGNIEMTGGLVFSGQVLTALVDSGMPRDQAYRLVQGHALSAWEKSTPTFAERIHSDEQIKGALNAEKLKEVFSLDRHLKHVEDIFARTLEER